MATSSRKSTSSSSSSRPSTSSVSSSTRSSASSTASAVSTAADLKNTAKNTAGTTSTSGTTASGYDTGSGYLNRETAFTWSDGSTTFSNATDWQTAATEGGKQGLNLVSAVSYLSSDEQKANGSKSSNGYTAAANTSGATSGTNGMTGFTSDIYSKDSESGKNYTNALTYENQIANTYGTANTSGLGSNTSAYGVYSTTGTNPYTKMLDYVQSQYDDFEDEIIRLNQLSIQQGANRLENQKGTVSKNYEENARQAYINYLQQQHALPEFLSAQGITGGATETAQLTLQNAYQGSLTEINNALAQAINDIDNSIYELEQSGNIEMAKQVLANSQAALAAYQSIMQNYINYDYQAYRDSLSDQRYNQEYADNQTKYENSVNKEEYDRVLELINNGFTVNNAADILGVNEDELDSYISYLNQVRQLEIEKEQASIAKTLSTIKSTTGSSSGSSSSSSSGSAASTSTASTASSAYRNSARSSYIPLNDASGFAPAYAYSGVTIPGYGTMTLQEAISLYDEGKGPITAYVNPSDYKIYFSA